MFVRVPPNHPQRTAHNDARSVQQHVEQMRAAAGQVQSAHAEQAPTVAADPDSTATDAAVAKAAAEAPPAAAPHTAPPTHVSPEELAALREQAGTQTGLAGSSQGTQGAPAQVEEAMPLAGPANTGPVTGGHSSPPRPQPYSAPAGGRGKQ